MLIQCRVYARVYRCICGTVLGGQANDLIHHRFVNVLINRSGLHPGRSKAGISAACACLTDVTTDPRAEVAGVPQMAAPQRHRLASSRIVSLGWRRRRCPPYSRHPQARTRTARAAPQLRMPVMATATPSLQAAETPSPGCRQSPMAQVQYIGRLPD